MRHSSDPTARRAREREGKKASEAVCSAILYRFCLFYVHFTFNMNQSDLMYRLGNILYLCSWKTSAAWEIEWKGSAEIPASLFVEANTFTIDPSACTSLSLCPFHFTSLLFAAIRSIFNFCRHENVRTQYDVTPRQVCEREWIECVFVPLRFFPLICHGSIVVAVACFTAHFMRSNCEWCALPFRILPTISCVCVPIFRFYWCQLIYELHLNLLYIMATTTNCLCMKYNIRCRSFSVDVVACYKSVHICSIDVSKSCVTRPFFFFISIWHAVQWVKQRLTASLKHSL